MSNRYSLLGSVFALLLLVHVQVATAEDAPVVSPMTQAYAQLLDPMIDEQLIPGYYLAVYKNGQQVVDLARGFADEEASLLPSQDVLYFIASMTKPIVSLATLKLVEQGRLNLADPVKKFIPEFSNLLVVPDGDLDNSSEELVRDVTIHDLLTHTSGLTYSQDITGREEIAKVYADLGIFSIDGLAESKLGSLADHIEQLVQLPLVFQPGEVFVYSVGIDVVGRVLEIVTGKPLDVVVNELVLVPLDMTDTHFKVPEAKRTRLAAMYSPRVATYPIPGVYRRYQPYQNLPKGQPNFGLSDSGYLSGGAGLVSTARDYAKLLAVMSNGFRVGQQQFISAQIGNKLFQNQLPAALQGKGLVYNFGPSASSTGFSYGLGIRLLAGGDLNRSDEHDYYFWAGAANTGFWIDLKNDVYGIFMTQHLPTQYDRTAEMVEIAR
jgi:CubicO group peptidase (beta-lactamase class C family)